MRKIIITAIIVSLVSPAAISQNSRQTKKAVESVQAEAAAPAAAVEPVPALVRQIDTIYLSTLFTTHLIFRNDISYADLSNTTDVAGRIIDQAKNKLALKARSAFPRTSSVSVEENNGVFHTYILKYSRYPKNLIIDTREGADSEALSKLDTIWISTLYTTHVIFSSDVTYADISRPSVIAGKLVEQGKNKLALKATTAFNETASLSTEEANGVFHTYIVSYDEHPTELVKDTRNENRAVYGAEEDANGKLMLSGSYVRNTSSESSIQGKIGVSANTLKRADAPMLAEIYDYNQHLYHLSSSKYKVRFTCENIYSYSDIIYMSFRLDNDSGISYEASDANFVIESNNGTKRQIVGEEVIIPKNRFGSLTAQSKGAARICYSFDKFALSSDQVLKVYLYEKSGQRNLVLNISYKDINNATVPEE